MLFYVPIARTALATDSWWFRMPPRSPPRIADAWTNLVALTAWARDHGMPAFEQHTIPSV